jgi:hypothetical protein
MGHADAYSFTPRQIVGTLHFAERRRRRESREALSLHAMAARGDPKAVKKQLKELDPD